MAFYRQPDIEESIKSFLIVGETLNGLHSYTQYQFRNLLTFMLLFSVSLMAITRIDEASIWLFLSLSLLIASIYFLLNFRIDINYAITKYRVIRIIEGNIITRMIFKSSRLIGFTDLHYEHVERITIETPSLSMPRLYLSLFAIAIGWLLLGNFSEFNTTNITLESLSASSLLIAGIVNIIFSLPTGGVRLILQSVSGDKMEFPESQTPTEFVDQLIMNCRTFLSYGAN